MRIESSVTSQPRQRTPTPESTALPSSSANSGSVARFGVNTLLPDIWTTNTAHASYPSLTQASSPRRCFLPRSVGASGNMHTRSSSRVTPLTSANMRLPSDSM